MWDILLAIGFLAAFATLCLSLGETVRKGRVQTPDYQRIAQLEHELGLPCDGHGPCRQCELDKVKERDARWAAQRRSAGYEWNAALLHEGARPPLRADDFFDTHRRMSRLGEPPAGFFRNIIRK